MRAMLWIYNNIEKIVILVCYVVMAGIIFVEVIRRFAFNEQAAWSTTIPVLLFLWITWFGASYNTKIRTHLRFDEFRVRLSHGKQFACLCMDAVLWIVFACIVIKYSIDQVIIAEQNWAIVQGTDNVLQWYFYLATPLAWALLVVRVIHNFVIDLRTYRRGEPLTIQTSMLGE